VEPLSSALYVGHVRHRRHRPHPHGFRYRIAQFYLDLDELPDLATRLRRFRLERSGLLAFRRRDYFGDAASDLKSSVLDAVQRGCGERPDGPVRLLTHIRTLGHVFNPVSFYYCFDRQQRLHSVLAEITNTPWNERHAYVLPVRSGTALRKNVWRWDFDKAFHVSPFLPMALRYDWRFQQPADHLAVNMGVYDGPALMFDATLALERRELTDATLTRFLLAYPAMTTQVVLKIYWNALLIRLKRNPFFDHPATPTGAP
jgi:hypothetical protein